ncbi:MAG: restriction endonuclease subunit S [Saprospiraceae bacterium]|nr:restriction endonuclease subunit S [Saprospiraceae bacterium]
MKSNYKPLGKYIQPVVGRNSDLGDLPLVGLSIQKKFIPSIANTIGTDMSTYRIIEKNQIAYGPVTSRNGDKITIALFNDHEKALISQAYIPFEVKDSNELDPEYLMMWFRRPEFDRYARFKSHGSAREIFDWDEMCNTLLPVPHPDKQREIVKEYNVIQNRIALNQQLIQKLEETAQAIYKQWFVEFEFPDENGKPYKSNGGEIIENEFGEIPKGWSWKEISSISEITSSKRIFENEYKNEGVPFYRGKEITLKKSGEIISEPIYISKERYAEIIKSFGKPVEGDILMTAVGTIGSTYMVRNEEFYFKDGNVVWFKNFKKSGANYFLYDFMQSEKFNSLIDEITIGSTQNAITITTFGQQKIAFPDDKVLDDYIKISHKLNKSLSNRKEQLLAMNSLKDLLLSKLATIEN